MLTAQGRRPVGSAHGHCVELPRRKLCLLGRCPLTESADSSLPATLRSAVRQEFARALRPPYETFITVAVNGALMSSAWIFLPKDLKDKVFTLHGTLAFSLVLAAWMYSDVPATNVLGPDAKGFPASAMAKNRAGDWRDPAQVRAWVRSIAAIIRTEVPHAICSAAVLGKGEVTSGKKLAAVTGRTIRDVPLHRSGKSHQAMLEVAFG